MYISSESLDFLDLALPGTRPEGGVSERSEDKNISFLNWKLASAQNPIYGWALTRNARKRVRGLKGQTQVQVSEESSLDPEIRPFSPDETQEWQTDIVASL